MLPNGLAPAPGRDLAAPVDGPLLTAVRFQSLADVPSELEWFANISNKSTRRAYENALKDFMGSSVSASRASFGRSPART